MPFVCGLDLGQTSDPTALVALEQTPGPTNAYAVRHIERFPLGTTYPAICTTVKTRLAALPGSALVIDQTGVGRPVVDMLRASDMPVGMIPVTITAGLAVRRDAETGDWHVPKKDLVGTLQVLLGAGRLKIARSLPGAALLVKELENFRVRITTAANESFGAWREGQHDDLVLAVALACWAGENLVIGAWQPTTDERAKSVFADAPPGVFLE